MAKIVSDMRVICPQTFLADKIKVGNTAHLFRFVITFHTSLYNGTAFIKKVLYLSHPNFCFKLSSLLHGFALPSHACYNIVHYCILLLRVYSCNVL